MQPAFCCRAALEMPLPRASSQTFSYWIRPGDATAEFLDIFLGL